MKSIATALLVVVQVASGMAQASFQDITDGNPIFDTKNSRGVAIGDYDNDGDDDILVSSDPVQLYRNDGNFNFTEVAVQSGIDFTALLSVWFDADNDGWLDLLASAYSSVRFYRNNGNGTFTDATSLSGFYPSSSQALLVGDLNGDQLLDVYSNNINKVNSLYVNTGSSKFVDNISTSGASWKSYAMGGTLFDIDHDHDLDIYITFDGKKPNQLFVNDGEGNFSNKSIELGLDTKSEAMGVDFADFDHNGEYELYISNLFDNLLMQKQPNGKYLDIAEASGTDDYGMGWGVVCLDYNNDTWADIYLANAYSFNSYPNKLYRNNGDNTFTDVAASTNLEVNKSGYGTATGDFDSDGKPDIVVINSNTFGNGVKIFRNNEGTVGNWMEINLAGTTSNKFGVGARVEITLEDRTLLDEVTAGSGYMSQNSFRVHAGLGAATQAAVVKISWPDGNVDIYENVAANARYLAIENQSLSLFNVNDYRQAVNRPSTLVPKPANGQDPVTESGISVARQWNEALLNCIRNDFARPTVHARNLFHVSMAMYDAWAVYDNSASTYLLGKTSGDFYCPFEGVVQPENRAAARDEAISYAAFRMLLHRFQNSPGAGTSLPSARKLFRNLGYDESITSVDYSSGSPAALGNYIASKVIEFGLQDGSNEAGQYANQFYAPVNVPMRPELPGNPDCADPNRWQQIQLVVSIDQNGQPVSSTPPFLGPEWGNVIPFALTESDLVVHNRDGHEWKVFHDPGLPQQLDKVNGAGLSSEFKWNFELVSIWASHLDPSDNVMVDISPASKGNIPLSSYPQSVQEYHTFYKLEEGGDIGQGYSVNPKTNQPYQQQIVPRGDYARVLAEFWADGPKSETPPGHWFTILNYVTDHPQFERKFKGTGDKMNALEWDVKSYLTLGGALHDVAIAAWGIKGYYDYTRPVFAIRYLAGLGQSSDPNLPGYHPAGIELKPGFIELVQSGDPLAGENNEHVGKVKLYTWRGPNYITDPATEIAGVGWILAENWWPYQRPTFVTPPFAGYISGHSTYSSAAAEVLTQLTGDEYFPGGMGEFIAKQNEYLVFEDGPSVDVKLQWARYKDASDQSSLSRIWGGIHPPIDDIPGRHIGKKIGENAFSLAEKYFGVITGMDDEERISTSLYPNPVTNDLLNIQIKGIASETAIEIMDFTGKMVFRNQISSDENIVQINTSAFPEGMYMVIMRGKSAVNAQKVLIKRH